MREALRVLRRGVQQHSSNFEFQYTYEHFINDLLTLKKKKTDINKKILFNLVVYVHSTYVYLFKFYFIFLNIKLPIYKCIPTYVL